MGTTVALQIFVIALIFAKSVFLQNQYFAQTVCYMIVEMTVRSTSLHGAVDMNVNLMFAMDVQRKGIVTKTDTFTVQEKLTKPVNQDILIPGKECGYQKSS